MRRLIVFGRFVLLLALWFGNKKPPRKALLDHPLFDLRRLQEDGIVVNGRQYFVRVLIVTTDSGSYYSLEYDTV